MKTETLQVITVARVLLETARNQCVIDDKYVATAGLVVLQDAVELIIYAVLIELGSDPEKLTFDQAIGQLGKLGYPVPNSGNIKALNKQRVLVKHFGQVADPAAVKRYLDAARSSIDGVLKQALGKSIDEILILDSLRDDEVRDCLVTALRHFDGGNYFDCIIECRKAVFIKIESDYSVEGYKDPRYEGTLNFLSMFMRGGLKAPSFARSRKWIEENVNTPFDYIVIDNDRLRIDLLEWGIPTQDFWNLWRLTPRVIRRRETKA